jgi:hypothetical protein
MDDETATDRSRNGIALRVEVAEDRRDDEMMKPAKESQTP